VRTAQDSSVTACAGCLRRSWLLALLSSRLDYHNADRGRLLKLLELSDEELLRAVGGKHREELKARYRSFEVGEMSQVEGVRAVCHHHRDYPRALRGAGAGAPRMLHVAGGVTTLKELSAAPTVAIVGSRRATDYGMEMAKSLARSLAASGVTVTSGLSDGIPVAAHAGVLEVDGKAVAVMDGSLDVGCPARRRELYARITERGCAVAELPCGSETRRWGYAARDRTLAALAWLTVVVEADNRPGELTVARVARTLNRTVAAVPGRVTSPVSRGTHALLREDAQLVRGPKDVLELLYERDSPQPMAPPRSTSVQGETRTKREIPAPEDAELEPRLRATLESVGAGKDTQAKLTAGREDTGAVLASLSELELMGLLARGDGGRYVPRNALLAG
jgi:DNA processing protein